MVGATQDITGLVKALDTVLKPGGRAALVCALAWQKLSKQIWQFKVIEIGLELDKIFIDISLMLYI